MTFEQGVSQYPCHGVHYYPFTVDKLVLVASFKDYFKNFDKQTHHIGFWVHPSPPPSEEKHWSAIIHILRFLFVSIYYMCSSKWGEGGRGGLQVWIHERLPTLIYCHKALTITGRVCVWIPRRRASRGSSLYWGGCWRMGCGWKVSLLKGFLSYPNKLWYLTKKYVISGKIRRTSKTNLVL